MGNLESLGILREIRNKSFKITCQVKNEILSNESKKKNVLTGMKKYCESVIKENEDRFKDKSIEIILI